MSAMEQARGAATAAGRGRLRWPRWPRRRRSPAADEPPLPVQPHAEDDEPAYRPIDLGMVRRLVSWLWPYRRRYALGILLGVVMVSLELQSPLFMRAIIDLSAGFVSKTLDPPLDESAVIARLCGLVALWAAILGVAILLQRAAIFVMTGAGERVQFDLRRAMFRHLQKLSMAYYDRTRLGRIISRFSSDLGGLRDLNVWGIDTVVKNFIIVVVASIMMIATEWRLFLSVVWLGPVLFVANYVFRSRISRAWQVVREGYTRVAANLAENITGVRVVTAFHRQDWNVKVFDRLQGINTANNVRAARINGVYQPTLQIIGFAGRAIILVHGSYLVATGGLAGVGSVVAFFLYWDFFMGPIVTFGNFHNQMMLAMAGAERIFGLLDTKPEVEDLPGAAPLEVARGEVRFERVTFGYDPARPVLHGIDLTAEPGQTVALVGPTGSGKSSIISLLARFYVPQAGRILIDGQDIRLATVASLRSRMALVLQSNYLFSGTVMENIRYARPQASDEDVIAAARRLGTAAAIAELADGFATEVGERGAGMSLGQRQLICFTRAFLADPRILLLDEATSAVDSVTESLVQSSLERLLEGRTTFVVAHRLSTITRADRIFVLESGRIVEAGRHAELLAQDGRYAGLYRQFRETGVG